ncbi:hypothetical protein RHSIM_Rhsim08G0109000 [Rhododendron simsii]|uniref:Uncharacterized protein n=1 Tax=Rhododendron simsii TaxID=118357 RepID=A0A834GJN8_RHOSS|nr:hypothetical protein RHSIM_Rhsim08G0109000 [Rhododendron simsii]
MASMASKSHPISQAEEVSISDGSRAKSTTEAVTSCIHLKSSSGQISQPLDKEVVLRRIRHHKCLNKIRNTFQALLSTPPPSEHRWLEPDDAFSAP